MTASITLKGTIISGLNNCDYSNMNLVCTPPKDIEIRQIYSKTLQAMKAAYLTTYYQTQREIHEGKEGIRLPRLFASFHPSPFKLIALDFCQNPGLCCDLPEVFMGLEMEFCDLQAKFQKLSIEEKQQILDDLIEHTSTVCIEFHSELDAFIKKIKESSETARIIQVFKQDVVEANKLISFIKELMHLETKSKKEARAQPLPFDLSLIRVLSKIVTSNEIPGFTSDILVEHLSTLGALRRAYLSLSSNSKSMLNLEFQHGRYGIVHQPEAEKVILGIEQIITKIKSNNRNLVPLMIFLAHKNSNGS